jgi:hypothetical protein
MLLWGGRNAPEEGGRTLARINDGRQAKTTAGASRKPETPRMGQCATNSCGRCPRKNHALMGDDVVKDNSKESTVTIKSATQGLINFDDNPALLP